MNKNTLKMSLRTLIVLATLALVAQGVAAAEDATTDSGATDGMTGDVGVGLALGLAAIGAGFSQAAIGSAAVGMLAEDGSKFGVALIFHRSPRIHCDSRCPSALPQLRTTVDRWALPKFERRTMETIR